MSETIELFDTVWAKHKIEKKLFPINQWENILKLFLSETTEPFNSKLGWNEAFDGAVQNIWLLCQ